MTVRKGFPSLFHFFFTSLSWSCRSFVDFCHRSTKAVGVAIGYLSFSSLLSWNINAVCAFEKRTGSGTNTTRLFPSTGMLNSRWTELMSRAKKVGLTWLSRQSSAQPIGSMVKRYSRCNLVMPIFVFSWKRCCYCDFRAQTGIKWKIWKFYILWFI